MTADETRCPDCGGVLHRVRYEGGYLNEDQFDSIRAGDWYCTACKGKRAGTGYRYFWDRELAERAPTPPDAGGTALEQAQAAAMERRQKEDAAAAEIPTWVDFARLIGEGVGCLYSTWPSGNAHIVARVRELAALRSEATRPTGEEDAQNLAGLITVCEDMKRRLVPFGASAEGWDSAIATLTRLRARLDRAEGIEAAAKEWSESHAAHWVTRNGITLPGSDMKAWRRLANAEDALRAALSTPTPPTP